MSELPIYKIKDKFYFRDKRLNEYRNIKNPNDRLSFNEVSLSDLQKPSKEDNNFIEEETALKEAFRQSREQGKLFNVDTWKLKREKERLAKNKPYFIYKHPDSISVRMLKEPYGLPFELTEKDKFRKLDNPEQESPFIYIKEIKGIINNYEKGRLTENNDEKYANGFWDLSGELSFIKDDDERQTEIYTALRGAVCAANNKLKMCEVKENE